MNTPPSFRAVLFALSSLAACAADPADGAAGGPLRGATGGKADEPEGPPATRYRFARAARLMDRNYAVVGCASEGVVVDAPGWIPYPKDPDGKPLRDPDDGGVLSALYEIVFAEDHACGDGFVARKGIAYWVSPRALSQVIDERPAHWPEVLGVEASGDGCPDRDSYSLNGAPDASHLSVLFRRLSARRLDDGAPREQQLECTLSIRLRIPKAGRLERYRSVTAYGGLLEAGASFALHSRVLLGGVEMGNEDASRQGPLY